MKADKAQESSKFGEDGWTKEKRKRKVGVKVAGDEKESSIRKFVDATLSFRT